MKDALQLTPRKGSRLSMIGIWTAAIGIVFAIASGFGARAGFLSPFASMGTYALGSLLLLVAAITAGLGLIRSGGLRGATSRPIAWLALLAGLAVTANNGFVISQARGAPAIHDISTDTVTPPAFVRIAALRQADAANPSEYDGAETAAEQHRAFPTSSRWWSISLPTWSLPARRRSSPTRAGLWSMPAKRKAGSRRLQKPAGYVSRTTS